MQEVLPSPTAQDWHGLARQSPGPHSAPPSSPGRGSGVAATSAGPASAGARVEGTQTGRAAPSSRPGTDGPAQADRGSAAQGSGVAEDAGR